MKRTKKLPAHSASVALRAMVNAALPPLECPAYIALRPQDRPFWDAILRARARDEWVESDLAVGAQLARCRADIEAESRLLDGETSVISNSRGDQVCNPRVGIIARLTQQETVLMRTLRMGGPIPMKDLIAPRGMQRAAERMRADVSEEDGEESVLA